MAIKGDFTADFSSFTAAVDAADVKLQGFQANSNVVQSSLNRMANALQGNKLMQDATLMAEAVERIGGVSKLTKDELDKLGNKAAEAVEKMERMGKQVPENLQALADHARDAQPPVEGLGARITGLVSATRMAGDAISGLVSTGMEWVHAADEQEVATVRLTTALRAQGTYTPEVAAQYDALASSFEATTIYSDDLITEMEALLTTVGGVMPREMNAALKASTDLAAGLRIDLPAATEMVAKALEGNTASLKRQGIEISQVALQTQGASAVFDAIAAKMGGAARDQAATFSGEMARLGNVTNNVEESFGRFIAGAIQPFIDTLIQLPGPIQGGVVGLGLLAKEAGSLATAAVSLAGSVALAAPLLGFDAAAIGAGALGGLSIATTALGAAAAAAVVPLGAVAIAIGSIWTAWKLGQTDTISTAIQTWALSSDNLTAKLSRFVLGIDQMTAADARAAIAATNAGEAAWKHAEAVKAADDATAHATQATVSYTDLLAQASAKVAALTEAQVQEVMAAKAMGASAQDLQKQFGLNAGDMDLLTKRVAAHQAELTKAADAAKKVSEAMLELDSAGKGWQGTLAQMDGTIVEAIKYYLDAGVSQSALATAFGQTAVQVKAVESAMKDHIATMKAVMEVEQQRVDKGEVGLLGLSKSEQDLSQKRMESAAKAADQLIAMNTQLTDDYNKQVMNRATYEEMKIWEAAETQIAAFKKTAATAEQVTQFSNMVYEHASNTIAALATDGAKAAETGGKAINHIWDAFDTGLRGAAGTSAQVAQAAAASFETALRQAVNVTEGELDNITQDGIDAMNRLLEGQKRVLDAAAKAAEDAKAKLDAANTFQGGTRLPGSRTETAFGQNYLISPAGARVPIGPHGELPDNWFELYSGKSSFSDVINSLPRFAGGGRLSAGMPSIVGERGPELFVPTSAGAIVPQGMGGASITQVFHITSPLGSPDAIARAVADAQVGLMRGQGVRLPYGT